VDPKPLIRVLPYDLLHNFCETLGICEDIFSSVARAGDLLYGSSVKQGAAYTNFWGKGSWYDATFGPGKMNQALALDGNGSYLEVPDDGSLSAGLSAMTLSAWVKLNSLPAMNFGMVGKVGSYLFSIGSAGCAAIVVGTKNYALGSPGTLATNAAPQLSIGNWVHLVGTYDGSFVNLYVNGTKEGSGPQEISGSIVVNPNAFYFGQPADQYTNWMNGMIDEVRLYNRALTDDEVKALYDSYK